MCPPTQTHTCYFYLGEAESTRQGEKSGEKKVLSSGGKTEEIPLTNVSPV